MLFLAPAVVRRNTDLSGGGRTPREVRVGLQRPPTWPMTAPFRSQILKCERRVTVQIGPTEARNAFQREVHGINPFIEGATYCSSFWDRFDTRHLRLRPASLSFPVSRGMGGSG